MISRRNPMERPVLSVPGRTARCQRSSILSVRQKMRTCAVRETWQTYLEEMVQAFDERVLGAQASQPLPRILHPFFTHVASHQLNEVGSVVRHEPWIRLSRGSRRGQRSTLPAVFPRRRLVESDNVVVLQRATAADVVYRAACDGVGVRKSAVGEALLHEACTRSDREQPSQTTEGGLTLEAVALDIPIPYIAVVLICRRCQK